MNKQTINLNMSSQRISAKELAKVERFITRGYKDGVPIKKIAEGVPYSYSGVVKIGQRLKLSHASRIKKPPVLRKEGNAYTAKGMDLRFIKTDEGFFIFRIPIFDVSCEELKKYREKYGNLDLKKIDGKLYAFVTKQIRLKSKGLLSKDKIKKLEEAGVRFESRMDKLWNRMFQMLLEFIKDNNHTYITQRNLQSRHCYEDSSVKKYHKLQPRWIRKLAAWANEQRKNKRKGKIDQWKVDKLDSVGFSWCPVSDKWMENYRVIKEKKENGVPFEEWEEWEIAWLFSNKFDLKTSGNLIAKDNGKIFARAKMSSKDRVKLLADIGEDVIENVIPPEVFNRKGKWGALVSYGSWGGYQTPRAEKMIILLRKSKKALNCLKTKYDSARGKIH